MKKMFPVLTSHLSYYERKGFNDCPKSIPWEIIEPHKTQAWRNHDQTLERLAKRGGLSPCELVAVLEDRKWSPMSKEYAACRLKELIWE